MKRVLQVALVVSVLLSGCTDSSPDSDPETSKSSGAADAAEIAEAHQRVVGVCNAILKYGLPLDGQTRSWLQEELELMDQEHLRDLAGGLERCAPDMAREISDEMMEPEPE